MLGAILIHMNSITERRLLWYVLLFIVVLTGLQILAQEYDLYWIFPQLDRPMHFLGGLWLGWTATWLGVRFGLVRRFRSWRYLGIVLAVSAVLGLAWEGFEALVSAVIDSGIQLQPSPIDTTFDLVLDMLGATLVATYCMIKGYAIDA